MTATANLVQAPKRCCGARSGGDRRQRGCHSMAGDAEHFHLKDSTTGACHVQGAVTGPDGGGVIEFDELQFQTGGTTTIGAFTRVAGNA